jgi:hypothetical protein
VRGYPRPGHPGHRRLHLDDRALRRARRHRLRRQPDRRQGNRQELDPRQPGQEELADRQADQGVEPRRGADGVASANPIDDFDSNSFTTILSAEADELLFRLTVDGSAVDPNKFAHGISTDKAVREATGSTTIVYPVSAGSHTIALQAVEAGKGDFIESNEISSLFVPNGSAPSYPLPFSLPF